MDAYRKPSRVSKTDSTGSFSYRRDGVRVTDPVLNDSAAEYTPGVSESRLGVSKFYHADRLGSTTKITDASQNVTDSRQYDAFGLLVSSSGSTPTPFGFVGKLGYQQDADTGLMLLGHRFYDPSTGRFLTRDPIKDGRNWYGYAGNNPERWTDASGLQALKIKWGFPFYIGHGKGKVKIVIGDGGLTITLPGGATGTLPWPWHGKPKAPKPITIPINVPPGSTLTTSTGKNGVITVVVDPPGLTEILPPGTIIVVTHNPIKSHLPPKL